jgi:endoglucanase
MANGDPSTRRYRRWVALGLLGAIAGTRPHPANACDYLTDAVPREAIEALSHGFNLDGWLNGPTPDRPDPAVLRTLRAAGMTHIRLPVSAERLMRRFSSDDDIKAQLRDVDRALTLLLSLGYHVSVDLHPGERFPALHRNDPEASMESLREAWSHLAPLIRRHPPALVFAELLNEPDIEPARWQIEAEQLAKFVRERLPRTTFIVGPTYWQRADSLPDFRPLSDRNVVYAIHFYDPMVFTHQGHWDPSEPLSDIRGLPFPIQADDKAVQDIRRQLIDGGKQPALDLLDKGIARAKRGDVFSSELQPAISWQTQFSRPLIINEFGVLKGGAPEDSRVRWLGSVVRFAEQHCWGWAHWEYDQGFGLLEAKTGKPDPKVMRALLQGASPAPDSARQINQR